MNKLIEKLFPDSIKPYAGRIMLTVLGFVVAVLCMTIGFWRTLLIAALTAGGYLLGTWADGALDLRRFPVHSHR